MLLYNLFFCMVFHAQLWKPNTHKTAAMLSFATNYE